MELTLLFLNLFSHILYFSFLYFAFWDIQLSLFPTFFFLFLHSCIKFLETLLVPQVCFFIGDCSCLVIIIFSCISLRIIIRDFCFYLLLEACQFLILFLYAFVHFWLYLCFSIRKVFLNFLGRNKSDFKPWVHRSNLLIDRLWTGSMGKEP